MDADNLPYSERVLRLMEHWNRLIEELKGASRFAAPGRVKKYDELVSELIAYREATRRGLLELDEMVEPEAFGGFRARDRMKASDE